jgi:hypothetical protein
MPDSEAAQNYIERIVLERQRFSVTETKFYAGMRRSGNLNHTRRQIDADNPRSATDRSAPRQHPRPRRDIEDSGTSAHPTGIEQRLDRVTRHGREEVAVSLRGFIVRRTLECAKRVGIYLRFAHVQPFKTWAAAHAFLSPLARLQPHPNPIVIHPADCIVQTTAGTSTLAGIEEKEGRDANRGKAVRLAYRQTTRH